MTEKLLQYGFEKLSWLVLKKYCSIQTNTPKLPNEPFMICCNHSSHLDTPSLMLALKKPFHEFTMLAAADYFQGKKNKNRLIRRLLRLILVDREANLPSTRRLIQECRQAQKQQQNLIIYPEGTRSQNNKVLPFKPGCAFVAHTLQMPILPAAIVGSADALPKNRLLIKPKKIYVKFGDFIYPKSFKQASKQDTILAITQHLETTVKALYQSQQAKHSAQNSEPRVPTNDGLSNQ